MAASDKVYPFSTQDGKAIPLDIINPEGLIVQAFTSVADASVGPIATLDVATFIASVGCIISFGVTPPAYPLTNGALNSGCLLIPAGVIVTVQCPETSFSVRGLSESGTLYVQLVRKWAGLALPKQFDRK